MQLHDICTENSSFSQKLKLILVGIVVSGGGSFHFGYQISVINPLADIIQEFLELSLERHAHTKFHSWTLKLLWPTVAGLLFIGAFLGAITAPRLMRSHGQKSVFYLASGCLIISFLMAFNAKLFDLAEIFILHRLLAGIGIGMVTTVQTVYLTEISPVRSRGFIGTLTGFSTSIGFALASGIGLPQVLGTEDAWHYSYLIEVVPSMMLVFCFCFYLPESPVESLRNGHTKEALACIQGFSPKTTASVMLQQYENELNSEADQESVQVTTKSLWRECGNALFICLLLNATVSFSGITAASFFGTFLLQNIGFSNNQAALANFLASFCGLLGNLIGSITIDRLGRRMLMIGCLLALALLNTLLMAMVFVFQITDDIRTGYVFLAIFMLFLFLFSLGVGPTAWFLATELSVARYRPQIQSWSVSCQYITCFISSLVFLPLYNVIGPLSFVIFIGPLTFCSLYLYVYLPETKNRSSEEIVQELKDRSIRYLFKE